MRPFCTQRLSLLCGLLFAILCGCVPPSASVSPAEAEGDAMVTGVAGRVVDAGGKPAAGAWVYAYRSDRTGLRGPADFAARVDADGSYLLDLTEGNYWLVARLRQGRADSGPPRRGDAWAPYQRNPVRLRAGSVERVDFILQKVVSPTLLRQGSLVSGDTGFSGTLVDSQGQPLVGAFALAYRDADLRRMPDFTSTPATDRGRFTLFVSRPGHYCIAARLKTRGQPQPGEPYGILGRGKAGCPRVEAGQILDVGPIVLSPFHQ
ncbi:hypothetical protein C2E25_16190 [Geothermobacter hydrogeniphilus]|uniref:Carboxypeptidase regulatory-like domain-containing protein n=1 Tax=Geothermobacter hydrogeniphilus TaxID=1969733 RepID=A0A2K2H673_9BACT|nr:carboxypeptidase-like regulatory domain-containing protein [Geothermobacter hydrogeniphilus]PNU18713.1 hypothetical protein C2E25_16190 [Geothermobacter hydrogeniphilus]